jgi:hypothetical protein
VLLFFLVLRTQTREQAEELTMSMRQLVFQHLQEICNHVQPLRQQADSLVHFEITSDGLVDGFELGFGPHEFGGVEDRALQVNVDAEDEELADLHVDFAAGEVDAAGAGDGGRDGGGCCDCCVDEVFVEGCLWARELAIQVFLPDILNSIPTFVLWARA